MIALLSALASASPTDESLEADVERMRVQLEQLEQRLAERDAEAALPPAPPAPPTPPAPPHGDDDDTERVAFGKPVSVHAGETVDEVVSFGEDVEVLGHVTGDAVSFGGDVFVRSTGRVDGDAVSFGGTVEVEPQGVVAGDHVTMGIPDIAFGMATSEAPPAAGTVLSSSNPRDLLGAVYRRLVLVLSIAGAGVLVVGLFPQRVGRIAADLEQHPVRAAVVGALATGFLTVFGVLFLVLTLGLGLPITLLLFALLGLSWLLGFVALCQAVGDRLPVESRPYGRWVAFLVGVVLLTFLGSLPWVGWLVVAGASLLGVGAAISSRFGGRPASAFTT
jgi:hypothetical protein